MNTRCTAPLKISLNKKTGRALFNRMEYLAQNFITLFNQQWLFFALAVTVAYTVGTTTGFGSNVLALAIITTRYPLSEALPVVIPLSLALSSTIIWQNRRQAQNQLLVRHIFPLLLTGFALGTSLFHIISTDQLQRPFALFIMSLAFWQLWRMRQNHFFGNKIHCKGRNPQKKSSPHGDKGKAPNLSQKSGIFGAGITQGLFASGGPLLVYSLSRQGLDKGPFRATLAVVWTVANSLITLGYAIAGMIGREHLLQAIMLLPFVPLGIFIGNRLHNKIPERYFYTIVYVLLALASILIFI